MKILHTLRRTTAEIVATSPARTAASVGLMLALSLTEGAGLLLLMPLLQLAGVSDPNAVPEASGWLDQAFGIVGLRPTLSLVLGIFVAVSGLRALLQRLQTWVNASLREEVTHKLRIRLYNAIAGAEWKFLVTQRPSEFVHVLTGEIGQVGAAGFQVLGLVLTSAISIVYVGMAFYFSPTLALCVLLSAGLLTWSARRRLEQARAWGKRANAARATLHAAIMEHVASLKTARSYGVTERHAADFVRVSAELHDVRLEMVSGESDLQQSLEFGSTIMLAVLVYVSFEILKITAAQLLVLIFVFARLIPRLTAIYRQVRGLAGVMPVLDSVAEIERMCLDAAEPTPLDGADIPFRNTIRFERVQFTYPRRADTQAVCDLDLEIAQGETTAIVGPSGAGKSTVADLLIGLLTPSSGQVFVDGVPLTADRLAGWRRQISYVPQDTFLFHDTIRANLTWVRPEASDAELWEALRAAAAEDFVAGLPQQLDTVVGERGILVSGGERQRLSLARALVRHPRVLVLDEATSSLDSENELRIQRAIEGLHRQMTIVVITHRLSTIRSADFIHVMDGGKLVESGPWDDLMARADGRFRRLCVSQGITHRQHDADIVLTGEPRRS